MRMLVLIVLVACGSSPSRTETSPVTTPPPVRPSEPTEPAVVRKVHEPFSLEVLGVELIGEINSRSTGVASRMTALLRVAAREDGAIRLGHENKELVDERIMNSCALASTPCMAKIAQRLGADQILYGSCEERGPVFHLELTLLDARTGIAVEWTGTVQDAEPDLQAAAKAGFASLVSRAP
jgi:hypothetical protein